MAFSLGADYREQTYVFTADPLLASGDISGFGAAQSTRGAVYDQEIFGELYLPLLKDAPYAKSVSLTLGRPPDGAGPYSPRQRLDGEGGRRLDGRRRHYASGLV